MDVFKPVFSTRNTWYHIRQSAPTVSWCDSVWFSNSTPKYAFMAWLTMLNRLTTGDRMLLWNINIDAGCVLCNQHLETREHLFLLNCCAPASPITGKKFWGSLRTGLSPCCSSSCCGIVSKSLFTPSGEKETIVDMVLSQSYHNFSSRW